MIGDVLSGLVEEWARETGAEANLAVLQNSFFGPRVRVSGLLTGGDIIANADRYRGDIVILPSVMLDKSGSRCIDGVTPAEISARLGKPVYFAGYLSDVDRVVFEDAIRPCA
jgi:NifB/MoaA-like Fe-S oxidoreductase